MFYEKRLIESLEKKYSLKENIESVYKNCQIIENENGLYSIIYKGTEVADNFKNKKSAKVAIDQEMKTWPNDPWGQGTLTESLNNSTLNEDVNVKKIKKILHIEVVPPIPVSVYYKLPGGPDPSMRGERRYETEIKKDIDCGYINIGNLLKEETEYRIIIYELEDMIRKKLINVLTRFVKQEKPDSRITDVYPPNDISDYVYINGLSFDEFCNVLKDRMTESFK